MVSYSFKRTVIAIALSAILLLPIILVQTAYAVISDVSFKASKYSVKKNDASTLNLSAIFRAGFPIGSYPNDTFKVNTKVTLIEVDPVGSDYIVQCVNNKTYSAGDVFTNGIRINCTEKIIPSKYSAEPFEGKDTEYQAKIEVTITKTGATKSTTEMKTTNQIKITCTNC